MLWDVSFSEMCVYACDFALGIISAILCFVYTIQYDFVGWGQVLVSSLA